MTTTTTNVRLKEIDKASPAARADLVAFVNSQYRSELPIDETAFAATTFFWAIDDDGVRVGCTGFIRRTAYLAEGVKTIVDANQRGRGLGEAISQALEDEVRRRHYKKLMSTILTKNLPMLFIKLKQGFLVEGIHMDHEKPGLHEYSLGKILS